MQCQELRKRKDLEVQILSEPVRGWEGDSIKSLGQVAFMSQVHVQSSSSEVRKKEGWVSLPLGSCLGVKISCHVVAQIHCFCRHNNKKLLFLNNTHTEILVILFILNSRYCQIML